MKHRDRPGSVARSEVCVEPTRLRVVDFLGVEHRDVDWTPVEGVPALATVGATVFEQGEHIAEGLAAVGIVVVVPGGGEERNAPQHVGVHVEEVPLELCQGAVLVGYVAVDQGEVESAVLDSVQDRELVAGLRAEVTKRDELHRAEVAGPGRRPEPSALGQRALGVAHLVTMQGVRIQALEYGFVLEPVGKQNVRIHRGARFGGRRAVRKRDRDGQIEMRGVRPHQRG